MLKKQTVWLLTMLSLMIVLSVYYITSPGDMGDQAFINDTQTDDEVVSTDSESTEGEAGVEISNVGQDELFTTIRMKIENERSMTKDRLEDVVASNAATTEQKNEALNDMAVLEELATKESVLEETILSANQYKDVLVRSDGEKVQVHVKTEDELSKQETVQIMQKVKDEFGGLPVIVEFKPTA